MGHAEGLLLFSNNSEPSVDLSACLHFLPLWSQFASHLA